MFRPEAARAVYPTSASLAATAATATIARTHECLCTVAPRMGQPSSSSRVTSRSSTEEPVRAKPRPDLPLCQTAASLNGGASSRRRVPLHGILGTTADGVVAYSNERDSHWTNEKHYDNGLFMGYKWQCVEFARRWLWEAKRLYLPSKNCAYCFADITCVYKPLPGPETDSLNGAYARTSDTSGGAGDENPLCLSVTDYRHVKWAESPCTFYKQGSHTAPVAGSLIIYPMSRGSPWGHIGVIVEVDLDVGLVYVADQNRFFTSWGDRGYSAAFRLDVVKGRYYIRDPESECKGWLVC